jgi:hypothetical protein
MDEDPIGRRKGIAVETMNRSLGLYSISPRRSLDLKQLGARDLFPPLALLPNQARLELMQPIVQ